MKFLKYFCAASLLAASAGTLWSCDDDDDKRLSDAVLASVSSLTFEAQDTSEKIITVYADARLGDGDPRLGDRHPHRRNRRHGRHGFGLREHARRRNGQSPQGETRFQGTDARQPCRGARLAGRQQIPRHSRISEDRRRDRTGRRGRREDSFGARNGRDEQGIHHQRRSAVGSHFRRRHREGGSGRQSLRLGHQVERRRQTSDHLLRGKIRRSEQGGRQGRSPVVRRDGDLPHPDGPHRTDRHLHFGRTQLRHRDRASSTAAPSPSPTTPSIR